jgi:ubiquinone/menaquinone biosynthesis C-methylase UbiE
MLTFDLSKIQLPDHGLMLDLGCGEGRHVFAVMEAVSKYSMCRS